MCVLNLNKTVFKKWAVGTGGWGSGRSEAQEGRGA